MRNATIWLVLVVLLGACATTARPSAETQAVIERASPSPTGASAPPAGASPTPPATAPPSAASDAMFRIPLAIVTITESRNGRLTALTNPGAACGASAKFADGTTRQLGAMTARADGYAMWTYEPATAAGTGFHDVWCEASGETATARNRFTVP